VDAIQSQIARCNQTSNLPIYYPASVLNTNKILAFFQLQWLIRINVAVQLLLSADACIIMPHKPSFVLSDYGRRKKHILGITERRSELSPWLFYCYSYPCITPWYHPFQKGFAMVRRWNLDDQPGYASCPHLLSTPLLSMIIYFSSQSHQRLCR
jgi:hypothetical protein